MRLFQKFMRALLLSPRALFFVAPSLIFCRPEPLFCRPEPLFCRPEPLFCRPEGREGSLGACAPRDDITGRRPERSEGCTACARQDKKGRSAGRSRELFEQPQRQFEGVSKNIFKTFHFRGGRLGAQ